MRNQKINESLNSLKEKNRHSPLSKYDLDEFSEDLEASELTKLLNHICQSPMATICFLDDTNLIIIGKTGVSEHTNRMDRSLTFSHFTVLQNDIFEIPDTLADPRFANYQTVIDAPYIRYYCGAPLITPEGIRIGALCIMDTKPRILTDEQKTAIKFLADVVILNLELKTKKTLLEKEKKRLEESEKRYRELFELSQGLIGEHDMNGRIISVNFATANSLGVPIESLIGRNMRETLAPESREQFDFYLEKIEEDGYAEGIMHVHTASGTSRYWAYKNIKVEDKGYP